MRIPLLIGIAVLSAATQAHAIDCRAWNRLAPEAKPGAILTEIDRRLDAPRNQKYKVNRARMRACLIGLAPSIEIDFDGECAKGQSASMSALDEIFRNYITSCVQ